MNNRNDPTAGLNPFLPFGTYIPDGEPKLFGDRVWLYGSYDRFGGSYCSCEYHVVSASADDLTKWTDHGVSFSTDDVPWSDALLYAPDTLCHNGRYYLFFCMSDGSEGVAESDSPAGPFKNARRITLDGEPIEGIDPSVIEYDGHIWYTWGQFELRVGELSGDLCSLIPGSVRTGVLSNAAGREGFHEGSSLRRVGDHWCMIYASEYSDEYPNNGSRPTKLDYAVADSPYGPYGRRGTVIDNDGCDPQSWNDHGSIIKINGEWYVFYHASSGNSNASRRARAERLEVNEEMCDIDQAIPTTNGFCDKLLPGQIKSPVNACRFFGGAYVTEKEDGSFPAVCVAGGSGFEFSPVMFEAGHYELTVAYKSDTLAGLCVALGPEYVLDRQLNVAPSGRRVTIRFTAPECCRPLRFIVELASEHASCEISSLKIVKRD